MTSAPPLPRSIEGWIKHLDPVRLPIAREQHLRISRALADSRLSLRDIALQMQDCPAIALSLLREANHPRSPLHSPAESLEVALPDWASVVASNCSANSPRRRAAESLRHCGNWS